MTHSAPASASRIIATTIALSAGFTAFALAIDSSAHAPPTSAAAAELGRQVFFDTNLSLTRSQSCASCHLPERAFTGNNHPDALFPVAIGASPELVGVRNTPTALYAAFTPPFELVEDEGEWVPVGGQFLDGRADTLALQAAGPFVNPREMAMPDKASVVRRLRRAEYAGTFKKVFGPRVFDDVERAYVAMTQAVEAFERTEQFTPFSSKFDAVLRGKARFTADEQRGFELFKDPDKGNCIACHVGDEGSRDPRAWLFTDFTYDNLGVPRNPAIPDNADPEFFDLGLCARPGLADRLPEAIEDADAYVAGLCGAFKVPTLRNVARTAPYMHNGVFSSLREVVEFYVTRDTNPGRWYPVVDGQVHKFDDLPPEYLGNVNTSEIPYDRSPGDEPRLSSVEIDQVVAFLRTLSDARGGAPARH